MGKHTPTPWRFEKQDEATHIILRDIESPLLLARIPGNGEACRANAEFIVCAVNCHDELLAACELGADWTPGGAIRSAAYELKAFGGSFDSLCELLHAKADAEEAAITNAKVKGDSDE